VDDPSELVFAEAVRALAVRRDALESLRGRAGVVLSGAAIVSSPRTEWQDATLPSWIVERVEEADPPTLPLILRRLALEIEVVYHRNTDLYERLARSFRFAVALLNLEVLGWIIDLASRA
jgi:hypothetical protein